MEVEDEWTWTDGSFWNFTYWNTGEPSNLNSAGNNESCLNMFSSRRTGKWNDYLCSKELKFLCKSTY